MLFLRLDLDFTLAKSNLISMPYSGNDAQDRLEVINETVDYLVSRKQDLHGSG